MNNFMQTAEGIEFQQKLSRKSAAVRKKSDAWHDVYARCREAKRRCTHHKDYAGRGIKFCFATPKAMVEWVIHNLGYPVEGASIDRINNDGHYEPGNLRWATYTQQARNKREYMGSVYRKRIKQLQTCTDYSYESIRSFIKQGMTDEQIKSRKRSPGGRPRIRHS